jgi:hypothetical protein
MEIWKEVKEYPDYEVSNLGRVKSLARINLRGFKMKERIISGGLNGGGYNQIPMRNNGIRKNVLAHRLVTKAFIPNIENKPDVNHKNGIKTDNRLENLEWSTTQENVIHAYKNGFCSSKVGVDNGRALLNESQVIEIRSIRNKRVSEIAIEYKVSWNCVSNIIKRKSWTHI